MSSIRYCVKVVSGLDDGDVTEILKAFDDYRAEGVDAESSARLAIDDAIAELEDRRSAILEAARAQHPDVFGEAVAADAPATPEPETPAPTAETTAPEVDTPAAPTETEAAPRETPDGDRGVAMFSRAPAVDSPAFRRWFGDSKVVDDRGDPRTVYHGTSGDIDQFSMEGKRRQKTDAPLFAHFFTDSPDLASSYAKRAGKAPNVIPAYLSLQNPLEVDADGHSWSLIPSPVAAEMWSHRYNRFVNVKVGDPVDINALTMWAKKNGHDGLIVRNVVDDAKVSDRKLGLVTTFVAFDGKQIKSAIGNNGNFDPTNPNITMSLRRAPLWSGDIDGVAVQQFAMQGEGGDTIGTVTTLDVQGKPAVLFHIESAMPGQGAGQAMLRDVLERAEGAEVFVANIQPQAQDWWRSVGATFEDSDGANPNGTIDLQRFEDSEAVRRAGVPDAGERAAEGGDQQGQAAAPARQTVEAVREELGLELSEDAVGRINVVQTADDLPDDLAGFVRSANAENDVQGIEYRGRIYLVAGNIRPGQAFSVLMHEAGVHAGLKEFLGATEFAALAGQIKAWARLRLNSDQARLAKRALQRVPADTAADMRDEELVAYFVEESVAAGYGDPKPRAQGAIQAWFARLWDAVRTALRKLGADPASLTVDDVAELARGALERSLGAEGGARAFTRGVGAKEAPAFSVAATADAQATSPPSGSRASWDAPEPGKADAIIRALQDKQIDTRRVIQAIRNASGALADTVDVYLQEELFHGRSAKAVHDFLDAEMRPLLTNMVARGIKSAEDIAAFEQYLWARHAEERNVQIAKVNPDMPDGGSGLTNNEAREILAQIDPTKLRAYEALAKRVDDINAKTRQEMIAYGLESPAAVNAWESAYQHYVPLQREDMEGGLGVGQGFSVKGGAKRATGSKRAVVDILANIAMQRERTIVRGEKNRVANALVGLAQQNPNPDFWRVDQPAKIRYIDERTGLVAERVDSIFKSRDNVVVARAPDAQGNIVEHAVIFNERDERATRMSAALKNLDAHDLGEVLGLSAKITRYFASINTQYNPIFGLINLTRDTQGALLNLSSTPLAGKQADVMKGTLSALRGIYLDERAARRGEQPKSAWAGLWDEFQKEGGQTGYHDMFRTSKDRADAIERELSRVTEGKAKSFGRGVFDWLADYNQAMENAVRLAAYKVGKESGMSNQRAASLAKNLTVNFNRRGSYGTQIGALYAFFNASVQGTARLVETLRGPAGNRIITGGLLLGAMQALLLAASGFEDDEPPEFVRERNLIIPIGDKKYLTIPMPLGLHILPNLARVPTEFALSGFRDPHKRFAELVNVFADAFNPIGNAGLSLQTIAPTIIDPVAALAENKDWTGKAIARENLNSLSPTPGHTRAKDTATEFSKAVSKALNWLTGGTNYKPGLFSPTPDQIDYLVGQVTGGLGREAMKIEQSVTSSITGEELPAYKIPLFGRFYGTTEGQSSQGNAFYENLRAINEHEAEIKGRRKAGEPLGDYIQENPEASLVQYANHMERQVQKLRQQKRLLVNSDASRDQIQSIDVRITDLMRRFNERVRVVKDQEAA